MAGIAHDAVDRSEPVYEELLRRLENDEWQSCTQFSESEMQMLGLTVGDEHIEDGEWRWRMILLILWEAVPCLMFI